MKVWKLKHIFYNLVNLCLQEVDIAIGSITITAPRETVCDFSVTYYETGIGFIAHIPRELSKWAALFRPYKLSVWLFIFIALICSGPVGSWISQHTAKGQSRRKSHKKQMNLERAYVLTLKIFVNQGLNLKIFNFISHNTSLGSSMLHQERLLHHPLQL